MTDGTGDGTNRLLDTLATTGSGAQRCSTPTTKKPKPKTPAPKAAPAVAVTARR